jgi:hypothetical protein
MDPNIFAEWLRRQGHQVYRSESSFWYDAGPRVFQAFPYHWQIQPSEQELHQLMLRRGMIAIRYSTPVNNPGGKISYHIVVREPYNMDILSSRVRNKIRRGLKHSQVEQISFERLANEGWELQRETHKRQGRQGSMTQTKWEKICLSAKGLPGFTAWGAIVNGNLGAALLTTRIDNRGYLLYALSHQKYFKLYINNALFYSVSCSILDNNAVVENFYGLNSLDAPESVDVFKLRMSYLAKPVRQRVVFHPGIRPFANKITHWGLQHLLRYYQGSYFLSKAEGMLRFNLQGKKHLFSQQWPECLSHYKSTLLETQ